MHQAFDSHEEIFWKESGGNFLRHPRYFSTFLAADDRSEGMAVEWLDRMRKSVNIFLTSSEQFQSDWEKTTSTMQRLSVFLRWKERRLMHLINQIKADWRRSIGLSSSISENFGPATLDLQREETALSTILDFFRLLTDHEQLTKRIRERIEELTSSIGREYQVLGLQVSGQVPERREILEKQLRLELKGESHDSSVLTSDFYGMPYSLNFYSPDVKHLATQLQSRQELPWDEILLIFQRQLSADINDYERLLFTAYLFGVWNLWALAEMYCDLALESPIKQPEKFPPGLPKCEGNFFRALCLRKYKPDLLRLKRALGFLDRSEQQGTTSEGQDPRIMAERATVILQWNYMAKRTTKVATFKMQDTPSLEEALSLAMQALRLAQDDRKLTTVIYNTLCFHYSNALYDTGVTDSESIIKIREYLDGLCEEQGQIVEEWKKWPPNYLDTIGWAKWIIRKKPTTKQDYEDVTNIFKFILSRKRGVLPESSEAAREHLRLIEHDYRNESVH